MSDLLKIFAANIDALNNLPNQGGWKAEDARNVILWILGAAGLVAVGVIIYGAIKYQTSQGDSGKTKQASQIIAYAIIGLLVVFLASAITVFVSGLIAGAAAGE